MANRKQSQQSISQHPLFPAIVALWFGAAFGLASLAIRPSFIEHFVVATGIDKVIPMAAPPLGTTTRILISLGMCALGGVIGSLAGHRIARPAAETRTRRRGAVQEAHEPRAEAANAAPKAAPRTLGATRRRALALNEEPTARSVADHAPVPGQPGRILNVAEFDLDGFEDVAAQASDVVVEAGEPTPGLPESPVFTAVAAPEPISASVPAPFAAEPAATEPEISVGRDRDDETPAAATFGIPQLAAEPVITAEPVPALRVLENRLFQTYAREIKARADEGARARTAPLFGAPAPVITPGFDLLPRLALGEWGEDSNEAPDQIDGYTPDQAPRPLFSAPELAQEEPEATVAEAPLADDAAPESDVAICEAQPAPVDEAAECLPREERQSAAERLAHAELGALSHVELLERLALAMEQQRRAEVASAAITPEATAVEPAIAEPVEELVAASVNAEIDPVVPLEDFTDALLAAETAEAEEALAPFVAPVVLPSAMRPLALDEVDEDEALPGYHPPRHIFRPIQADEAAAAAPFAPPAAELVDGASDELETPETAEEAESIEDQALEAGYSSLLDLSRPASEKPRFVRIEEPESVAIEPVVIFPGEAARAPAPFAGPASPFAPAPAVPVAAEVEAAERAFDPPSSPLRTGAIPASAVDTEKALRAALATLQRMSGAA